MENIVLIIHLILALLLIGAVLLQQSEGGALGMGGGGNVMSGRSAATALQRATWGLAGAFVFTSLLLALFAIDAARDEGVDLTPVEKPAIEQPADQPAKPIPAIPSIPSIDDSVAPKTEAPKTDAPKPEGTAAGGAAGSGAEAPKNPSLDVQPKNPDAD